MMRERLAITGAFLIVLAVGVTAIILWCRGQEGPASGEPAPSPPCAHPSGPKSPPPRPAPAPLDRERYAWGPGADAEPLSARIPPPVGYRRVPAPVDGFAFWLRSLPLRPGRPLVRLYDGSVKRNQGAHHAVVDIDPGRRDLQQCADAVIRLRAEYLWQRGRPDAIDFHFTSGDLARWCDWRGGSRPRIRGNRVTWSQAAAADSSRKNFRRYLDTVFTYAGTRSLANELEPVRDPSRAQAGDVFIQGGSPGHAVLVVDAAENDSGHRVLLLAQSYMPAQDVHILVNPDSPALSPWYPARRSGELATPEWRFRHEDLRRFR